MWPVEGQPAILQVVTELLPMRIGGNTMTNIALKGWTSVDPVVMVNIAILVFHNAVLVLVLIGLEKKCKTIWVKHK